jgi:hypothetical protein
MQPVISQALLATRIAETHRQAQLAQRARGLKRARRRAQQAPDAGAARHTAGPCVQLTLSEPAADPQRGRRTAPRLRAVQMGKQDRRNKP